jgi:hypothetical protein
VSGRTEYEVTTSAGTVKLTTPDRKLAMARAKAWADQFPKLEVFEVFHPEPVRRRVWRERPTPTPTAHPYHAPTLVVDNSDHIEAALAARKLEAMP